MSKRKLDEHGNWRSKAVTFNMSPEEDELFERMVHISGLCKRDFIAARLLNRDVMVQGNPKVYKALKDEMAAIRSELERIAAGGNVSPYLLDFCELCEAGGKHDFEKRKELL